MKKDFADFEKTLTDHETIRKKVLFGATNDEGIVKNDLMTHIMIVINILHLYHNWVSSND